MRLALACLTLAAAAGVARVQPRPPAAPPALRGARQLVLVTAATWDTTGGTLQRYERGADTGAWRPVGAAVPVTLGRSGLAWGAGQGEAPPGTPAASASKREGDGRSPAGAFPLLHAFGYAPDSALGRLPYLPLAGGTACVDDPRSLYYNAVVDGDARARGPWLSAERMREVAGYRRGVVVAYNGAWTRTPGLRAQSPNGERPARGRGSCIFLHVWDGPTRPTEGCTATTGDALADVVAWLDPSAQPVLVQLPEGEHVRLRPRWGIP